MGRKFRNPITVQGVESEDGRLFKLFEYRDLPLSMRWVRQDTWGHDGAEAVAVLKSVEMDDAGLWWGEGEYVDGITSADDASTLADAGAQFISADPGGRVEYHWLILDAEGKEVDPKDVGRAYDDIYWGDDEDGKLQDWLSTLRELCVFDYYQVGGITQVDIPCWPQCRISLLPDGEESTPAPAEQGRDPLKVGTDLTVNKVEMARARRLMRRLAAGPAKRPAAAYAEHDFDGYTPFQIDENGVMSGHICGWNACHRGFTQRCVTPTYQTTFPDFHTGTTHLDDGTELRTGVITHVEGHLNTAAEYDRVAADPACQLGSARLYADRWGIQVAGMTHADVTPEQAARAVAGAPSGDWRGPEGGERLHAIAMVNTPGYVGFESTNDGVTRKVASIPPPAPAGAPLGGTFRPFFDAPESVIRAACACEAPTEEQATNESTNHSEVDCGCGAHEGGCTCSEQTVTPKNLADMAHLRDAMSVMRREPVKA